MLTSFGWVCCGWQPPTLTEPQGAHFCHLLWLWFISRRLPRPLESSCPSSRGQHTWGQSSLPRLKPHRSALLGGYRVNSVPRGLGRVTADGYLRGAGLNPQPVQVTVHILQTLAQVIVGIDYWWNFPFSIGAIGPLSDDLTNCCIQKFDAIINLDPKLTTLGWFCIA